MIREEIRSELHQLTTEAKDLRKFGITMGIILGILTGVTFYTGNWAFPYLGALAGGFLLIGIIRPLLLREIYLGWMAFAITLGFFMTRIILSFLFYVVFTITGIIVRLARKDMLDQQYDTHAETYWKKHDKPKDPKQHLERQF